LQARYHTRLSKLQRHHSSWTLSWPKYVRMHHLHALAHLWNPVSSGVAPTAADPAIENARD
jgi:hypothetical protein